MSEEEINMSDRTTPETDGELKKLKNAGMDQAGKWIQTNFARKLERERDEAIRLLKLCADYTLTTHQEEVEEFLKKIK